MSTFNPSSWVSQQLTSFTPKSDRDQLQFLKTLAIYANEENPLDPRRVFDQWIATISDQPGQDSELIEATGDEAWAATEDFPVCVPLSVEYARPRRSPNQKTPLDGSLDGPIARTIDVTSRSTCVPYTTRATEDVVVASIKSMRCYAALLDYGREFNIPYSAISITTRNLAKRLHDLYGGFITKDGKPDHVGAADYLQHAIAENVIVCLIPGRPHEKGNGGGLCGVFGLRGSFQTIELVIERGKNTREYRKRMQVDGEPVDEPLDRVAVVIGVVPQAAVPQTVVPFENEAIPNGFDESDVRILCKENQRQLDRIDQRDCGPYQGGWLRSVVLKHLAECGDRDTHSDVLRRKVLTEVDHLITAPY